MIKLLVVEDEVELAKNIGEILKNRIKEIDVFISNTIQEARNVIHKHKPDLLILDINLPDGRGTDLHKEYKEFYPEGVVIFLTAIDSDIERIVALELGADDYIVKPFNFNELTAKVKNWVKRISKSSKEYVHIFSDYYFDRLSGSILLYRNNFYHQIDTLNYRESKVFEILIENLNKTVDVEEVIRNIDIQLNDIPSIIYHLRKKLAKINNLKLITIKGGKIKLVVV
ncbi:MAG: response regulator transcription factor [Candidatus Calescibacterium sp.]|nr:response regulator transcription factor [Candidatus Calescibacterium sp.]MCX7971752.1 response regulator transcription factor [bacterium]MDW8195358.1 response regulator transcription factor [Candidatus Calescibacterium sp.]